MKLLVITCASERVDELLKVIDEHEVHAFTEMPGLRGSGTTGRHMGTRAFPGTVSLILTAVSADKADELVRALEGMAQSCAPGEGLRVLVLPVEKMV